MPTRRRRSQGADETSAFPGGRQDVGAPGGIWVRLAGVYVICLPYSDGYASPTSFNCTSRTAGFVLVGDAGHAFGE